MTGGCNLCVDLKAQYHDKTEDYVRLLEQKNLLLLGGQIQQAKDLAPAITRARNAKDEATRNLATHGGSHPSPR